MAMNVSRSMNLELHYGAGVDGRFQQWHADADTAWATDIDYDRVQMSHQPNSPQWVVFPGLPRAAATGVGLHGKSTRIAATRNGR